MYGEDRYYIIYFDFFLLGFFGFFVLSFFLFSDIRTPFLLLLLLWVFSCILVYTHAHSPSLVSLLGVRDREGQEEKKRNKRETGRNRRRAGGVDMKREAWDCVWKFIFFARDELNEMPLSYWLTDDDTLTRINTYTYTQTAGPGPGASTCMHTSVVFCFLSFARQFVTVVLLLYLLARG